MNRREIDSVLTGFATLDTPKTVSLVRAIMMFFVVLAISGCEVEQASPGPNDLGTDRYAERWNANNDPDRFRDVGEMEYRWDELSGYRTGSSASVPWPDTYWPTRYDGYNHRWQGESTLSPVERYDQAFNSWTPSSGFMSLRPFSSPGVPYDRGYYDELGPAATWAHIYGGNYDVMNGRDDDGNGLIDDGWDGIESWFGHCHAWAPAAYYVPEPQRSVTINDVTFEVGDIKALAESVFEESGSYFLGGRCNRREVLRDSYGRIIPYECRDTNAGSFHIVTVNMLGRHGNSFVIDANYDYEVWNFPVNSYNIILQEEVSLSQALALLDRHDVSGFYPYSDAVRFVHVEMELEYVVESYASALPFGEDHGYRQTVTYEYLLELDRSGNIIGGEWIEAVPHPDFMWATYPPTDVHMSGSVVISAENVQELLDQSTSGIVPSTWTCSESYFGTDDGCDCGCGVIDPDCGSGGCVSPGCYEDSCGYCYDESGASFSCTNIHCACSGNYNIGDRVWAVVDSPNGASGLSSGATGTVVAGSTDGLPLLVEWDGWSSGHSGNCGYADCGSCDETGSSRWWVDCDKIDSAPPSTSSLDCACSGNYEVGDRVRAVVDRPAGAFGISSGTTGTVVAGSTDDLPLLVEWDGWSSGHSGNCGHADCGSCDETGSSRWWINCDDIEIDSSTLDCACSGNYEVGDRVQAVVDRPAGAFGISSGDTGTVVAGSSEILPLLIEWDDWSWGHSGGCLHADCGDCDETGSSRWWINCDDIEPGER